MAKRKKKQSLAPVIGRWFLGFSGIFLGITTLFAKQLWVESLFRPAFWDWYRGIFGVPSILIGIGILGAYVILDAQTFGGILLLFTTLSSLIGLLFPNINAGFFDIHSLLAGSIDTIPSFFLLFVGLCVSLWLIFGLTHKHVLSAVLPFLRWKKKAVPTINIRPSQKTDARPLPELKKRAEELEEKIAKITQEKTQPSSKKITIFGVEKKEEKVNAPLSTPQKNSAIGNSKIEIVPSRAVTPVLPKKPQETTEKPKQLEFPNWEFPPASLLKENPSSHQSNEQEIKLRELTIEQTLLQFRMEVSMEGYVEGPTVTQFRLRPSDGIKLSRIENLKKDLTLALKAKSIRIEAPIPGMGLVGIEVPNDRRDMVTLREVIESPLFRKHGSKLAFAVGKDISGNTIVGDLAKMPHLLVAGQTGSGKSVGINGLILSLLYRNTPSELRMILIDPKRVEMGVYNGIPHLLCPVINGPDKALNALKWCVTEMIRRYDVLTQAKCRNLAEFNEKAEKKEKMPAMVVVIDELADFMMSGNKKEIENAINRIAQMGRAAGMHLVVATQRPSVDVITGLIKANIPSRIAFTVASQVDSRTILDSVGAEDLLGRGDMLYAAIGENLVRVQGVFVSTEEVESVIHHIKRTIDPDMLDNMYNIEILEPKNGVLQADGTFTVEKKEEGNDDEQLISQALEVINQAGRASTSLLQRRLGLGYPRAARLMDEMRQRGLINDK